MKIQVLWVATPYVLAYTDAWDDRSVIRRQVKWAQNGLLDLEAWGTVPKRR